MSEESKNNKKSENSKDLYFLAIYQKQKVNQAREFLEKMDEFTPQQWVTQTIEVDT